MKYAFILLLSFLLINCSSDDTPETGPSAKTDIKLVTGILLRSDFTEQPIVVGNPNDKSINNNAPKSAQAAILKEFEPLTTANLAAGLIAYPNPAINSISLNTNNVSEIDAIWFLKGEVSTKKQDVDFQTTLKNVFYEETLIDQSSILKKTDLSGNTTFTIDLSTLDNGFYRVFVKSAVGIEWQNIYVANTMNALTIEEITQLWP